MNNLHTVVCVMFGILLANLAYAFVCTKNYKVAMRETYLECVGVVAYSFTLWFHH